MEIISGLLALFDKPEVGVAVHPILQGKVQEMATLDGRGVLALSPETVPQVTGFQLVFQVPKENPPVLLQRSLNRADRADKRYQDNALFEHGVPGGSEWHTFVMLDHVVVSRNEDGVSWTRWRGDVPNRVDIWSLDQNRIRLFQIGIIVQGMGTDQAFRVLGELRGEWDLYWGGTGITGIPTYPEAGEFSVRQVILENDEIRKRLAAIQLPVMAASLVRGIPALEPPTNGAHAVMQWWSPFAGMRGQGPCTLKNGSSAWVCGEDVVGEPDEDGIVRLPRGTQILYEDIRELRGQAYEEGGRKKSHTLTKLIGVRRV